MNFLLVPLSQIDFADESFRISDNLLPERLVTSIREIGVVAPVVLLGSGEGVYTIVCGFRRLHAMRQLGVAEACARVESGAATRLQLMLTAFYDNLSHRALTCFEQARVLCRLGEFGLRDEILVSRYMTVLGLKPSRAALDGIRRLLRLSPDLRALVLADRLTETSAQRLAAFTDDDQASFARLLQPIRLSATLQRKVLDLVEDLAAIGGTGVPGILEDPGLRRILGDDSIPPPQKGDQVHDWLTRRRYPRLSRAHEGFRKTREGLGLPGNVSVAPDPYFETPRIRFSFEASGPDQFRSIAAALEKAGSHPLLADLFSVKESE
jgi:hypothetical protein